MIGSPVRHSLSPALHNAGFADAGLDWVYAAFEVAPGDAARSARGDARARARWSVGHHAAQGGRGRIGRRARPGGGGAAQRQHRRRRSATGDSKGYSTDGAGFVASLAAARTSRSPVCGYACFGGGGAARAIVDAVGRAGAAVDHRRQPLGGSSRRRPPRWRATIGAVGRADDLRPTATCRQRHIGRHGHRRVAVRRRSAARRAGRRRHRLPPALHRAARGRRGQGARTVEGLGMLVHQAVLQQQLWTGASADGDRDVGGGRAGVGSRGASNLAADASIPHRRRIAWPGAGRDRRGPACRAADHGRGDPGRDGPSSPRLRTRPAPEVRAGRVDAARRCSPRAHARLPGGDRDQEQRVVPQRQVARGDVAGARRHQAAADPGSPGARRPGGHAEVRLHRRPRCVRARQRPRDRGASGCRRRGQEVALRARRVDHLSRDPDGLGAVEGRRTADDLPISTGSTNRRCAASTQRPKRR